MAILFADGFDHYATAQLGLKWDVLGLSNGVNFNTIDPTGGRNGKGAYSVAKGTIQKNFVAKTNVYAGFAFNMFTGSNSGVIMYFQDRTTGKQLVALTWNSDNTLKLSNLASGTTLGQTTATYSRGSWMYGEVRAQIATSIAAHSVVLRINGAVVIDVAATANTTSGTTVSVDSIGIGSVSGVISPFTISFDDFVLFDTTGTVNNDFIGDVIVEAIYPTAQGNYSNFTSVGAGSNYGAVNEHPPNDDTSYVSGTNPFIRDSYTFGTTSQTILSVKAIQPVVEVRKEGTGDRAVAAFYRQGGVDYDQTAQAQTLGTSYGMLQFVTEINPATGVAYTDTEIAAIEAGIKVTL